MIRHSASSVTPEDFAFIDELRAKNFVGMGRQCELLRTEMQQAFNRETAVLTDSGAAALEIGLRCLHVLSPAANEVVLGAYVCPAVVCAIQNASLRPVFVDVRADSMNLSVTDARRKVSSSTLAVICVSPGGIPDDFEQVADLGPPVISDCAQSIGASYAGIDLAGLGALATVSMGPTKVITAGSGGAVLATDRDLGDLVRRWATEELDVATYRDRGFVPTLGQHFSDLNAGLGRAQLAKLGAFVGRRRMIASEYDGALSGHGPELPATPSKGLANYFRYYFFSDKASQWIDWLRAAGIDARPSIAHDMAEYFAVSGECPNLRRNVQRMVSLPIYPSLSDLEIQRVLEALRAGLKSGLV